MRLAPCVRRSVVARAIPTAPLRSAATITYAAPAAPSATRTALPQIVKAFAAPAGLLAVGPQDQVLAPRSTRQEKLAEKACRPSSRNTMPKDVAKYAAVLVVVVVVVAYSSVC